MSAGPDATQGYKFGWVVACGGLSNLGNPALLESLHSLLGAGSVALPGLVTAWSVVVGLAAAAVRPWSWYLLLLCHGLGLLWLGLYATLVAPGWADVAVGVGVGLPYTVVSFVYFYRRRAMFGARRRWRGLEWWWPGLAGLETASPQSSRGFGGLALRYKILVIVIVGLLVMIGRR